MATELLALSVQIGLGLIYWFPVRKWYRSWGATDAEVGSTLFMCVLEPAAFIMTRKMLLGLKRRAEAAAARSHDVATHAA